MLKIDKNENSLFVEGMGHDQFPYDGAVIYPLNSLVIELDESDMAVFHSAANWDVAFSGKISEITIEGETVTKDNICEKFGAVSNVPQGGGGGGLTPEQEQKLNNAVQTDTYNADKEAQAHVDENQNAAINGKANVGDSYTKTESDGKYQPKGNYPTFTEMQASLNGKADKTTTYTKTQVDSALSVKTNTDLNNLSDAGKENLKKMIQGGNAQIENGHVITADEAAMKWTIDFDEYVEVLLTKGSDWNGVQFSVSGTRLNVFGDGGNESLICLYEKDTDKQFPIYDGEGYSPVALDNYYIKITEGYTLTYTSGSGKLVSQQPSMFTETDPIFTASPAATITEQDIAKWNQGGGDEHFKYNPSEDFSNGLGVYSGSREEEQELIKDKFYPTSTIVKVEPTKLGYLYFQDKEGYCFNFARSTVGWRVQYQGSRNNTLEVYLNGELFATCNSLNERVDLNVNDAPDYAFKFILEDGEFKYTYNTGGNIVKGNVIVNTNDGYLVSGGDKVKLATEEDLKDFVNVEGYNQHMEAQAQVDATQNTLIEGLQGSKVDNGTFNTTIERIDSKINDIELYKFPNATIVGEPVIQSGQVSGFSNTNYLQFPFILDLHNKPFQIDFVFTTGANVTTQQNVLDSKFGIAVAIKDGKGLMAISSDGQSWNVGNVQGTMAIEPNTTYYAQLTWDGAQYKTLLSTDGVTYAEDMVLAGTERPYPTTIYIGGCDLPETLHTPHPFMGTINLNKAHLKVNGTIVWDGMDDVGLASRLATDMNNIDAAGVKKVKEIVAQESITLTATLEDGSVVNYTLYGKEV